MEFKFDLKRHQTSKISRDRIISELENVAKLFNYTDFKQDDFNKVAKISYFTVYREFGSWEKAMQFLFDHFKNKGIAFKITTRRKSYTTQEIFDEMERIWVELGHRPSRNEWVASSPRISFDTVYRHFGGWTNACLRFIEYKSGKPISIDDAPRIISENPQKEIKKTNDLNPPTALISRNVSLALRLKVLSRDNFRCVFCGKSPATDVGTILHIDHITPFSQGGKSIEENLQTLCFDCNLGKSDRKIIRE